MNKWMLTLCVFMAGLGLVAQESASQDSAKGRIAFEAQLKTNHLWRGFNVTDAPMLGTKVAYVFPGEKWQAGIWAGGGFTGDYREFDYFISFQHGNWRVALWDIFNFSTYMPADRRIFDYDPATTLHFIDLSVGYTFGPRFPLDISVATILYGRDRSVIEIRDDVPRRADRDRFSTYVQLTYPIYQGQTTVKLYVAGAFAFAGTPGGYETMGAYLRGFGRREHFYGEKANIVNAGVEVSRNLNLRGYTLPTSATAMWNPEANFGSVQVAFNLF